MLTSELVGACDERTNSLPAHIQVGQAAATQNVVGLSDILADPSPGHCALERDSIIELVLKLFVLIVYAMMDDNRRDETKASIGSVDAHDAELIEEKLKARCLRLPSCLP